MNFTINPGASKNLLCTPMNNGAPGTFNSGSVPAFIWNASAPISVTPDPSPGLPYVNNQVASVSVAATAAPGTYPVEVVFGTVNGPVSAFFNVVVPVQPATTASFSEV